MGGDVTGRITATGGLPVPFTTFVGRRHEVAETRSLLGSARLLTLTGVGGVGKTRLALEVAAASSKLFTGGVWLVDLAAVGDPSEVGGAVARALGIPESGARPVVAQVIGYLSGRRALLVLDNCEHVADACAELAQALLSSGPEVHIVATSRQTLGLTGEHILAVSPLPQEEAVELLRQRAVAVRPDFQVTDTNRAAVRRLCDDLDGVPLAIELVASRLRTLTVEDVAERLADRFALLTGGSRTALPRQRTLRATVDWSWDLCTRDERLLWSRLSVFSGGFTLSAAEGVCEGEGIGPGAVLDLLDRLIAQSVVLPTEAEGQTRYRMLETIRQYGRERLAESGEEELLLLRHRDFFLAFAQRIDSHWLGPGQAEALARLRAEHANLLAALECDADPQVRLALVSALRFYWWAGGLLAEGRRQYDRALAAAPEPTAVRARALPKAAWVALLQGDLTVADSWLDEAETLVSRFDEPMVRVEIEGFRGVRAQYRGQLRQALAGFEGAVAGCRALGDDRAATAWMLGLAQLQAYLRDPRAVRTGSAAVAAAEAQGECWNRAQTLKALGYEAWTRGDLDAAVALMHTALECLRGLDDHVAVGLTLEHLAWATASGGEHLRAARLLGAAGALWRSAGTALHAFDPQMADDHRRCEEQVVEALGRPVYVDALAEGADFDTPAKAIEYTLDSGAEPVGDAVRAAAEHALTRREREVAALVAQGMSNKQIAVAIGRSPRTAEYHIKNVLAKLDFESRSQIAAWWTATSGPTP